MINCQQTFISNNQAPEIAQPSKGSLDLPATFVTRPHFIPLFSFVFSIHAERHEQTSASASKLIRQVVRIVSFIPDQVFRSDFGATSALTRYFDRLQGFFRHCYFRRRTGFSNTSGWGTSTGWQGLTGAPSFLAEAPPLRPGSLRSPGLRSVASATFSLEDVIIFGDPVSFILVPPRPTVIYHREGVSYIDTEGFSLSKITT